MSDITGENATNSIMVDYGQETGFFNSDGRLRSTSSLKDYFRYMKPPSGRNRVSSQTDDNVNSGVSNNGEVKYIIKPLTIIDSFVSSTRRQHSVNSDR
jgi:hypothetical protein